MLLFNTIKDVQFRFATPVLVKEWPDARQYNNLLKDIILKKQAESEGGQLSNRGGWQSQGNIFGWGGEAITALSKWITQCLMSIYHVYYQQEFIDYLQHHGKSLAIRQEGWANINKKGDWNAIHNHPNCHWSGCYYVQVPEGSGAINFFDPRPQINMMETGDPLLDVFRQVPQSINPVDGHTIIFPSWIQHNVATQEVEMERISIAFNMKLISGQG